MDTVVSHGPDGFSSREGPSPPELVVDVVAASGPTVVQPPRATPSPVTGTSTALSVLGDDDGGEPALVYTWSTVGAPPAAVSFSPNGSNAAKNATATFTGAGQYELSVLIRDADGATTTAPLSVTVNQTVTTINVAPAAITVVPGGMQGFSAHAIDQFGTTVSSQPVFTWSVSGGGTITGTGVFTAASTPGGPFTVTATAGGKSGTALVTISGGGGTVIVAPEADAYVRDGSSADANFGSDPTLVIKTTSSAGTNRVSYLRFPLGGVTGTVTSATLRLFGSRPTASTITDSAFAVASNTWTEGGITWNNRPAPGAQQGSPVNITTTARYYEWDVTAFVRSQKTDGASAVSLAVGMNTVTSAAPDVFNSRQAATNPPQLVVTTGP
jgi:hypothetical protein